MGALIFAEGNDEGLSCGSIPEKIRASDPVVYQLVRVEGDGRLVPATDDELMEVEHLLEDDKNKLHLSEAKEHSVQCPSNEGFPSNMSDLEGPEGPLKSGNLEIDPPMPNATNEEDRLQLKCEAVRHSPDYMVVDGQSSDNPKTSKIGVDKVQSESTSIRTATYPICLSGQDLVQSGCAEPCSDTANEAVSGRSSVSESYSSKPDFSVLKGEVCLDNLTIRELQEVFRATFGRQTNVKDKLWLKRRIAMGLTNSCHVPTSSFVIRKHLAGCSEVCVGLVFLLLIWLPVQQMTSTSILLRDIPTKVKIKKHYLAKGPGSPFWNMIQMKITKEGSVLLKG